VLCNIEAQAAGLGGTFNAVLAHSEAIALAYFSSSGVPWVRVDGVALIEKVTDLTSNKPLLTPVTLEASGRPSSQNIVWTGATSIVAMATDNCADWSTADAGAGSRVGRLDEAQADAWFGGSAVPCSWALPVYCFEF
jgi:hypothetical protein